MPLVDFAPSLEVSSCYSPDLALLSTSGDVEPSLLLTTRIYNGSYRQIWRKRFSEVYTANVFWYWLRMFLHLYLLLFH